MNNNIINILDSNYDINTNLEKDLNNNIISNTKNYIVIGIIGGQSTGKSTLLNYLFNTNFSIMDSTVKRGKTTVGINSAIIRSPNKDYFLLDIEGNDSKEHWENKHSIENKVGLFGLTISNLLIVNIWISDIGRFASMNYELLKNILEYNLQLFENDQPKKLLFVIRDFPDTENFSNITKSIYEDIKMLWSKIEKPVKYDNIDLVNILDIEFAKLSHYIYCKDKFLIDINNLKERIFNPTNDNYLFKNNDFSKNILFKDIPLYISNIYNQIKSNKEINLPCQKTIISNYRCNCIKNEALETAGNNLQEVHRLLELNPDADITKNIDYIFSQSIEYFVSKTMSYEKDIVTEKQKELQTLLSVKIEEIFKNINEKKINDIIRRLEDNVNKISNENNILIICRNIKNYKIKSFEEYSDFVQIFKKFDAGKMVHNLNNFKNKLDIKLYEILSSKLNFFLKKIQNLKYKELEKITTHFFRNIDEEGYIKFKSDFKYIFDNYQVEVNKLKTELDEIKSLIKEDYLKELKNELFQIVKNQITKNILNAHRFLIEMFKDRFENDDQKVRKNWKNISDEAIESEFKLLKTKFEPKLIVIKNFTLPNIDDNKYNLSSNTKDKNDTTYLLDKGELLSSDDFNKINDSFNEGINAVLESVYNKKYNRGTFDRIPKWFWAIFIYAVHDNILEWIKSPVILFILIVISITIGYLSANNKLYLVFDIFNLIKNTIFRNRKIDINKKHN